MKTVVNHNNLHVMYLFYQNLMNVTLNIMDEIREELVTSRQKCAGLQTEILHKDDTILRLTSEVNASQSINRLHDIARKRAEAIESNRIEYENRSRTTYQPDLRYLNIEGYDEIDSCTLSRFSNFN